MSGTQRSSLGHRGSSVMGSHLEPKEKLLPQTPSKPTWPSEVLPLASSHLCIHSEFEGAACMYRRMVSISHQVVQSSLVAMGNSLHLQGAPPAGTGMLLWSSLQSQTFSTKHFKKRRRMNDFQSKTVSEKECFTWRQKTIIWCPDCPNALSLWKQTEYGLYFHPIPISPYLPKILGDSYAAFKTRVRHSHLQEAFPICSFSSPVSSPHPQPISSNRGKKSHHSSTLKALLLLCIFHGIIPYMTFLSCNFEFLENWAALCHIALYPRSLTQYILYAPTNMCVNE